jgi:hypothetical protein
MMTRRLFLLLLPAAVFLTACSGSLGPVEVVATGISPSAADINAAAERAALSDTEPVKEEDPVTEEATETLPTLTPSVEPEPEPSLEPTETPLIQEPAINRRVVVGEIGRFAQLLPFDGIRPVYEPNFASAADSTLDDNELIIGIALGGEAKAYSISVLRFREMVNDELARIPILVTW